MDLKILFEPITKVLKLQKHTQEALARLGIIEVKDLLLHKPSAYLTNKIISDKATFRHGERIIIEIEIKEIELSKKSKQPTKIYAETVAGPLILVFFHKIPVFLFNKLRVGTKHVVEGKLEYNQAFYFQIIHPNFIFDHKKISNIEPIYPLTYAITSSQIYGYIIKIFEILDPILAKLQNSPAKVHLFTVMHLIKNLHFPKSIDNDYITEQNVALAKYELIANQIHLIMARAISHQIRGRCFPNTTSQLQQHILERLNFTLTDGQKEVLAEIISDQSSDSRMVRMLQGDVGSGKTLVALLSMLNVASNNVQSVLMAPTDLLAIQHYEFFSKALQDTEIKLALLTGKISNKNKKLILSQLADGKIDILIGTHAVFQEKVIFKDLGYIIIDEQHRFGVEQRLSLINKATIPDLLLMTATPIPRSLTLTFFGDMDSSRLKSKPHGRLPIITTVISMNKIDEVMDSLQKKLDSGEKIYWICPLIENNETESENIIYKSIDVETRFNILNQIYKDRVGIIHGKMPNDEKDNIMENFKQGKIDILVATTVIEVGIDVPNATLIVIENAEKFGLSQLHQLRGRVGRSNLQSHAILIYEPKYISAFGKERLSIMKNSNDGFYIAEQDLILRGSGEIVGTKQSGYQDFIFVDLVRDIHLLEQSSKYAKNLEPTQYNNFAELIKFFSHSSYSNDQELLYKLN